MSTAPRRKPGKVSQEIASLLREHLARRRMSQREIARRTELSTSQISRYFKADVAVNIDELVDICDAIGTHPDLLFSQALHNIRWREQYEVSDPTQVPVERQIRYNLDPRNFPPQPYEPAQESQD